MSRRIGEHYNPPVVILLQEYTFRYIFGAFGTLLYFLIRSTCDESRDTTCAIVKSLEGRPSTCLIERTSVRPAQDVQPVVVDGIRLLTGFGIGNDCHADPLSARQVLLVAQGAYQELGIAPMSLRENILVSEAVLMWSSGTRLKVGADVVLRVTFACEPCAKLNRFRAGLMRKASGIRGILARVVRGGLVNIGDAVQASPAVFPTMSNDWRDRVATVVRAIPRGVQLSYTEVARLAGVHSSYCRVFPRLLADREDLSDTQVRRVVSASRQDTKEQRPKETVPTGDVSPGLRSVAATVFGDESTVLERYQLSPVPALT